jgi:CO/xanthine dehydrogenase Mo-binding subunit
MGEGASTSTPRAIANALYNAIGVRVDEIPMKPEKVLAALARGEYTVPAPPTPAER